MIHTNTGTTIPAQLTDAPTAYKDGVTDALWHPAITLAFDRGITDAEIAALLAGAVSVQQDDGRYLTVYTLDGRRFLCRGRPGAIRRAPVQVPDGAYLAG